MENFLLDSDLIPVVAPYAVASGAGVLVGGIFGVAAHTAASGATVTIATEGVFTLPKATGSAWTSGQRLYWDDSAKVVTTVATSNYNIGCCYVAPGATAPASGATSGAVLLGSTTPAGT